MSLKRFRSSSVQQACNSIMLFSVFRLNVLPPWKHDGDSPRVGMVINLVRPAPAIERKPVPDQRRNDFASGSIPKLSVIDRHESDGHRHARFDGNLDLIGRFLRIAISVLKHALDDHADEFLVFLGRAAPRPPQSGRPLPLKRRAIGVPPRGMSVEIFVRLRHDFKIVRHSHYSGLVTFLPAHSLPSNPRLAGPGAE